ncbi:hypothetical protein Salat_1187400 [Sesamum alatum]|uniref:Myb/SANT-like domain-containing protein n=1 Tax=Sesamum alatum TaxID=300844 RepID=A0AAE1YEM8_9LAMI|nr:hypothetical protein Salat_1187400 [Sesamum alatum]
MGNKWRAPPLGRWTQRVDICFIDFLAWMAERGHKQLSYSTQDLEAVEFARDISTFKTILAQPDFEWNPKTNRLLAQKEAWDHVFRAAIFPPRIMLEAGPSTPFEEEDPGPSNVEGVGLSKRRRWWSNLLMRIDRVIFVRMQA